MDISSERRLVENEILFREANRKVQARIHEDRKTHNIPGSTKLHFYCECSNFHCRERVVMATQNYNKCHQNDRQFVTLPGHENPAVETVVNRNDVYVIVEKHMDPSVAIKPAG